MKKIVIDVFGADYPEKLIRGVAAASREFTDVTLVVPGEESILRPALLEAEAVMERIELLPASEVITNLDAPADAILKKRNSSLVVGIRALKEDEEAVGMISAGNTGAVLVGAALRLGRLPGVTFPALASVFTSPEGRPVIMLDCGANVDVKPEAMVIFAHLGSALISSLGVESPRVALLSVGVEDKKGNALTHAVFPMLKESSLNFVGNMEACDMLSGKYDVVVCDGFDGNVVIKSLEGAAKLALSEMVKALGAVGVDREKINAALAKALPSFDYTSGGGGVLLGVAKPIVKAHGAANEKTVPATVRQLLSYTNGDFIARQRAAVSDMANTENK